MGSVLFGGQLGVTLTGAGSPGDISVQAGSATATAGNSGAGNVFSGTNTATAHANALIASGGDMTISGVKDETGTLTPWNGSLTVHGGNADATTLGSGTNTANANANAATFAVGAKTVNVSGTVNLAGGTATATGAGTKAYAFAMLDPASLTLNANGVNLIPGTQKSSDGNIAYAGAVLSSGGPLNLTVGGEPKDLATIQAAYTETHGVTIGQTTVTSSDPIIISVNGLPLNLTELFGLPAGFLTARVTEVITPNIPLPADIFRDTGKALDNVGKQDQSTPPPEDKKKDKTEKEEKKEEKQLSKGLKAECE